MQKVVLISGCSDGGIGWHLAQRFGQLNHIVYATARNTSKVTGLPENCIVLQLDVTDESSIQNCIDEIVAREGRIDILINNAGHGLIGPSVELSQKSIQRIFDVNVFGLLALTRSVSRVMIPQNSGLIANVGSIVGTQSTPWGGAYSATKFAVHAFTQSMRMELAPFGINVTLILPGAIRSNIGTNNVDHNIDIPENTLFGKFVKAIHKRAMISQESGSTPTPEFARVVVDKLLQKKPPRDIWYGKNSWLFWFVGWLPGWMVDWMLAKNFNLSPGSEVKRVKNE